MTPEVDVRLIVITDAALAAPRTVAEIVEQAVLAGAPAIQLRHKNASARELAEQARALLPSVRAAGALLFINDRLDVALAVGADGVHLGPHDLPVAAARRISPPGFLVGCSTDDPDMAIRARDDGASYIGCGAIFGTTTKTDLGAERIGTAGVRAVADAVDIPVVGIGGVTPANARDVFAAGAAGVAVVGAVMTAPDVALAVRALLGCAVRAGE